MPAENRFFNDISAEKKDFLFPGFQERRIWKIKKKGKYIYEINILICSG